MMLMSARVGSLAIACLIAAVFPAIASAQRSLPSEQPKLVLGIVVDQFRYDYLTRFETELDGGIGRLLDEGAVFTNANYDATPTVTAVGHSTFLSGAMPSVSGIVGNSWYDRGTGSGVESITDNEVQLLGGRGNGASPRRLQVSTIGDELKLSGRGGKVVGVSLKNRAAILPSGHMADGAYWTDGQGNFVSSTYYFDSLPKWVQQFNASDPARECLGLHWAGGTLPSEESRAFYSRLDASPCGDMLVQKMALDALESEDLGTDDSIDLLTVSYSSIDYVGHQLGPDSPEIHDMVLRVDDLIGELINAAEQRTGEGNVLVVLTADHGVAPVPEVNQQRKMPGGRIPVSEILAALNPAISAKFGDGKFLASISSEGIYFSEDALAANRSVRREELENLVANVLRAQPHIARAYTRTELLGGAGGGDDIDRKVRNGFHPARSPDVVVVLDPYYLTSAGGTTHGSPYEYDTHVPVIFWDSGNLVEPGHYPRPVGIEDIAPTLATMLGIQTPSGAMGEPLREVLP